MSGERSNGGDKANTMSTEPQKPIDGASVRRSIYMPRKEEIAR